MQRNKEEDLNKIAEHPLQTWEWGEFRKTTGNKVLRTKYGQITIHKIPLVNLHIGMFLKGPKPTSRMLEELKKIGKKHNLIFIKLEPAVAFAKKNHEYEHLESLFIEAGAIKGKPFFTPSTFWVDLKRSEEEIFKNFSSKTRYNIRLAERKGIEVTEDNSEKSFENYINLMRQTVKRQKFYAHSEKYHRLMWDILHQSSIAHLLTAKYKGEPLVSWILFLWKDKLYYPYGASSDKHKNLMAPNLMMWEAIKFGKKHNLETFDLWGREIGKGFTKFKEGYSPQVVEFLGSWDLITSSLPLYNIYRIAEMVRWGSLRIKSKFQSPSF